MFNSFQTNSRLKRFFTRLPIFLRAFVAVIAAKLALTLFSYNRVEPWMRRRLKPSNRPLTPAQIGWAVEKAGALVPGASCLPRAIAAQWLLATSGHEAKLTIGIAQSGAFAAHAWVMSGGAVVVGGSELRSAQFKILTESALPR